MWSECTVSIVSSTTAVVLTLLSVAHLLGWQNHSLVSQKPLLPRRQLGSLLSSPWKHSWTFLSFCKRINTHQRWWHVECTRIRRGRTNSLVNGTTLLIYVQCKGFWTNAFFFLTCFWISLVTSYHFWQTFSTKPLKELALIPLFLLFSVPGMKQVLLS